MHESWNRTLLFYSISQYHFNLRTKYWDLFLIRYLPTKTILKRKQKEEMVRVNASKKVSKRHIYERNWYSIRKIRRTNFDTNQKLLHFFNFLQIYVYWTSFMALELRKYSKNPLTSAMNLMNTSMNLVTELKSFDKTLNLNRVNRVVNQ